MTIQLPTTAGWVHIELPRRLCCIDVQSGPPVCTQGSVSAMGHNESDRYRKGMVILWIIASMKSLPSSKLLFLCIFSPVSGIHAEGTCVASVLRPTELRSARAEHGQLFTAKSTTSPLTPSYLKLRTTSVRATFCVQYYEWCLYGTWWIWLRME